MKKVILILTLLFVVGITFLWVDFLIPSKTELDPACFASDKIRVEIGGERYNFPREIIRSMRGDDVVNSQDSGNRPPSVTSSGSKACQKPEDDVWQIHYASLDFYLIPCPANQPPTCTTNRINLNIVPLNKINGSEYRVTSNARTIDELLERCTPPKKPWNDAHARSWSRCLYLYDKESLNILMKFKGGVYPPAQIDKTIEKINTEIDSYKVK